MSSGVLSSGATVVLGQEMMLDGTTISAAFDNAMDMGIVGTTAGTLWYINWSDNSSIRLVSGHKTEVPVPNDSNSYNSKMCLMNKYHITFSV